MVASSSFNFPGSCRIFVSRCFCDPGRASSFPPPPPRPSLISMNKSQREGDSASRIPPPRLLSFQMPTWTWLSMYGQRVLLSLLLKKDSRDMNAGSTVNTIRFWTPYCSSTSFWSLQRRQWARRLPQPVSTPAEMRGGEL